MPLCEHSRAVGCQTKMIWSHIGVDINFTLEGAKKPTVNIEKSLLVAIRLKYDLRLLSKISQSTYSMQNQSRIHIPISVNKHSFENCIHHVFNFILIFLKLKDKQKVILFKCMKTAKTMRFHSLQ